MQKALTIGLAAILTLGTAGAANASNATPKPSHKEKAAHTKTVKAHSSNASETGTAASGMKKINAFKKSKQFSKAKVAEETTEAKNGKSNQ